MPNYASHISAKSTPQSEKIPGSAQVQNSAGGFSFQVDDWMKLDRFLILGTEGGSYYAGERKMTIAAAEVVLRLLSLDGARVVKRIAEVSEQGRAPKNDPAIFALAICLKKGDPATRRLAASAVPQVCRIGTHIFQLCEAIEQIGGWGHLVHKAITSWYAGQKPEQLGMNLVKYQNRNGWSHKDVLRQSHAKVRSPAVQWAVRDGDVSGYTTLQYKRAEPGMDLQTYHQLCKGALELFKATGDVTRPINLGVKGVFQNPVLRIASYKGFDRSELPNIILGYEEMVKAKTPAEAVKLIESYGLPRETVPTELLNSKEVWEALLMSGKGMPFTAMIRNLGKMSALGLLDALGTGAKFVCQRLTDTEGLKKARVHPIALLLAASVYGSGQGVKGSLTWATNQRIVDALDEAFYKAFDFVEPTGKRHMLAIDISGSMSWGSSLVAGTPLTARDCAAAMAMLTLRTEQQSVITAFSAGSWYQPGIMEAPVSPKMRLDEVIRVVNSLPAGGTDCALPMVYALEKKMPVDVFEVYTDNETWAGTIHPVQALQKYRQEMGIPAKLIVVGMVSNDFSIADPNDAGMMDVVGFDTSAPQVMADFVRA